VPSGADYEQQGQGVHSGPTSGSTLTFGDFLPPNDSASTKGQDTPRTAGAAEKSPSSGLSVGTAGTPSTLSQGNAASMSEGSGRPPLSRSENGSGGRQSGGRLQGMKEAAMGAGQPLQGPAGPTRDGSDSAAGQAGAARQLFLAVDISGSAEPSVAESDRLARELEVLPF
jgi:hypothetical protein